MTAGKFEIVDIDVTDALHVLERIQPQVSSGDHAFLEGLLQSHLALTRIVRERGTTIARLRGLLGGLSSEKTNDVCPGSATTEVGSQTSDSGGAATTSDNNADRGADPADGDRDRGDGNRGEDDAKKRRKGHGRIPASAYPNARHVAVKHETVQAGATCPDCACGKLHPLPEPARIMRIFGQPPLAARIWDCDRLRCGGCGQVFTARAPAEAQGPKYSDSAASMMATFRYGAGMPLNRLAHLQSNWETPVPASTQWEVVSERAEALAPVYDELVRCAAAGKVLHNDDTHVRILDLMGKRRAALLAAGQLEDPERTGLFTTGVIADTDGGPIALFFSGRQHAGENLADLLAERDAKLDPPIQMCDGLARNLPKDYRVLLSNCLAHGRRHIVDEVDNFPAECRHVLEQLGAVFHNEATCKELGLTSQQRLERHQRDSGPVMSALRQWMKDQFNEKRIEPNSGLGEAFRYLLTRWDPLTLFLRVPGAPLDNNIVERGLKMAIRQRNNSLFYKNQRGADVGDLYMTLIYTAELHGENSFEYLCALFEHEKELAANPSAWLPWTYRATLAALAAKRTA